MKKNNKSKNLNIVFLAGAVILFLAFIIFIVPTNQNKNLSQISKKSDIYFFPENPKQGGTIFIKFETDATKIDGYFDSQKIAFFRLKNSTAQVALFGVSVDELPGKHQITVNYPGGKVEKDIQIWSANFPSTKIPSKLTPVTNMSVALKTKDNPVLYDAFANSNPEPYFDKPFAPPLLEMRKSGFGFGAVLIYATYQLKHLGIDLGADLETKIYAINDGKVVFASDLPNYGNTLVVDHGEGIFSLYLHLDKFQASVGQMVKQNQIVGLSGNTGYTSGPHLHFSIKDNGTAVDPISFIDASELIGK